MGMDQINKKPNFMVIGAMKAGTTSMYHYLEQHPEIFMSPKKEPHYFLSFLKRNMKWQGPEDEEKMTRMTVSKYEDYLALFDKVKSEKCVGEASAMYLYYPEVMDRIYKYNSDMKLIVMLRNPVDRAYSSYMHLIRDGRESLGFNESLVEEANRVKNNWLPIWHYASVGMYAAQLDHLFAKFSKKQVHIIFYDELKRDAESTVRNVFEFLGVNQNVKINLNQRYNVSGVPKSKRLQDFLRKSMFIKKPFGYILGKKWKESLRSKLLNVNLNRPIKLDEHQRSKLFERFENDINQLEKLLGVDLSIWKDS